MDVLLVEGEAQVRELLAEELLDAGFDVTTAPSAEAAMAVLKSARLAGSPPTILVTGTNLGEGAQGLTLAMEARRCWPKTGVIVMTENTEHLSEPEPREVRLRTPLGPLRLTAAVNELMVRCRH